MKAIVSLTIEQKLQYIILVTIVCVAMVHYFV
jgi:hypothetical protein